MTSKSLLLNLPLAIVSVLSGLWLLANLQPEPAKPQRRSRDAAPEGETSTILPPPPEPASSSQKPSKWRDRVGSGVVESAWETLCGSILQEVRNRPNFPPTSKLPKTLRQSQCSHGKAAVRAEVVMFCTCEYRWQRQALHVLCIRFTTCAVLACYMLHHQHGM